MLVLIPGSWECSFPGRSEASAARSAAPPGLSRCRTPHGAARQQVTALHHCHRGSALAGYRSQQSLGKGSGEAQSFWDFWPGKCFPSPRCHSTVGGSTAQSQK